MDSHSRQSIRMLMDRVRAKYGRMRTDTKTSLDLKLANRLASTAEFDTHVATLRENFNIIAVGGYLI